jgi:hypothetical protein
MAAKFCLSPQGKDIGQTQANFSTGITEEYLDIREKKYLGDWETYRIKIFIIWVHLILLRWSNKK